MTALTQSLRSYADDHGCGIESLIVAEELFGWWIYVVAPSVKIALFPSLVLSQDVSCSPIVDSPSMANLLMCELCTNKSSEC